MKNKNIIKRDSNNSILFDKNLSLSERTVLLQLLSNEESITNESIMLLNDLNIKTVQKMMKNFEKFGYIRREKLGRGFFYTIDSLGELNLPTDLKPLDEVNTKSYNDIPFIDEGLLEEPQIALTIEYMDSVILKNNSKEGKASIINYYINKIDKNNYDSVLYIYNEILS